MTVETVTSAILAKMSGIGKCQRRFILYIVRLLLQMRGRVNFTNLARYSNHAEQYFRKWFSEPFDFAGFNTELVLLVAGEERILGFDPSFMPKSGKRTPGVGYFWSGCAQSVKWGMELCGISVIDLTNHTAFHYEALQTVYDKTNQTLREYYAELITQRAEALKSISKIMVFDAFFSKKAFVDSICEAGFTMVSRLQHNAYLRYRCDEPRKGGKGRPKMYGGQIDPKNVCAKHFKEISRTADEATFEGLAHVRSLGRWVMLVIVQTIKDGKVTKALLYFSTAVGGLNSSTEQSAAAGAASAAPVISGEQVARYYPSRFLMEFGFRDGKQFLGLTHCQSRKREALGFHFNITLTTLNIAKVVHWLPRQQHGPTPFSMADIKTQYSNEILLDRLISIYGKDPFVEKNRPAIKELYDLGRMAA
jgi:hypothetical protein